MAKGRIKVDKEMCKGCGLCVWACPKKIMALDDAEINSAGYNPSKCINEEACIACATCARVCPDVAITVEKID